jgi:hypothetical protein
MEKKNNIINDSVFDWITLGIYEKQINENIDENPINCDLIQNE